VSSTANFPAAFGVVAVDTLSATSGVVSIYAAVRARDTHGQGITHELNGAVLVLDDGRTIKDLQVAKALLFKPKDGLIGDRNLTYKCHQQA
jgi:hypothetical protein